MEIEHKCNIYPIRYLQTRLVVVVIDLAEIEPKIAQKLNPNAREVQVAGENEVQHPMSLIDRYPREPRERSRGVARREPF